MAGHPLDRAVRATLENLESRVLLSLPPLVPVYNLPIEAPANQATGQALDNSHQQNIESFSYSLVDDPPQTISIPIPFGRVWFVDSGESFANGHSNGTYLHSGESFAHSVDMEIPSRGFNWRFERKYRSGITYDTPLGHNWSFNYDQHLVEATAGNIGSINPGFGTLAIGDVIRVDGGSRADIYHRNPDGTYQLLPGYYTRLVKRPDGTFAEYDSHGNEADYSTLDPNSEAVLTSLRDRQDNRMRFEYDAQNRLERVIDTLGRPIEYFYDAGNRLDHITDFANRTLRFQYDANGDLIASTTPAVTGTPNGNDFPNGKTTRYTYSSGFGDPKLNHNLISIIAPNENPGPVDRVFFTYDNNPGNGLDRVQMQRIGGTNASGVPAGGTINYSYTFLPPPAPGDLTTPAIRVSALDRNGNRTDYSSNQLGNVVQVLEFTNRNVRPGEGDYTTTYTYSADSEVLSVTLPRGNSIQYVYDSGNPDRMQHGNLLSVTGQPGGLGGDQNQIRTTYTYEPIYNQVRTVTEARSNDPGYVPQNGGANSPTRYRTVWTFDYQEGTNFAGLGLKIGRTPAEVQTLINNAGVQVALGDLNSDGLSDIVTGNVIREQGPTVTLLPGSNQAVVEGTTQQPIVSFYSYNSFGQLTRLTDAEANATRFYYYSERDPNGDGVIDNPAGAKRTGGYLREVVVDDAANPIRNSGTNPAPTGIRSRHSYDAAGNITRVIDARGIATDYAVNQLNETVQIIHASAIDIFGPSKDEPMGLVPFRYVEQFFYDANGNLTNHLVEDRKNTSQVGAPMAPPVGDINGDLHVDDLDLGILVAHFGQTPATPEEGDLNGDGVVNDLDLNLLLGNYGFMPPRAFVDVRYTYDILDNRIQTDREVSFGQFETFLTRYDPNGYRMLEVRPTGTAWARVNDERDLVFQATEGALTPPPLVLLAPGDPTDYNVRGGLPSTYTYHYDGNRNLIESVDASDTDLSVLNNSDIAGFGDRTRYIYDGFDRRTSVIDSVGNQTVYQYDPAGNVVRLTDFGPIGGTSPLSDGPDILPTPVSSNGVIQSANLVNSNLLGSTEYLFDELSRQFQQDGVLFVNTIPLVRPADVADGATSLGKGNLTPGDNALIPGLPQPVIGRVSTRYEYDRNSRQTFLVEDDTDTSRTFYDGAGRVIRKLDPQGNTIRYAYDDNGNLIETQETDVSQVAGIPNQIFLTTSFYDSLNRLQRQVDNIGRAVEYRYDSRGNLVAKSDATGPSSGATINRRAFTGGALTVNTINDPGNVTRYFYDGINRLTRSESYLTANGQGDGVRVGAYLDGFKFGLPTLDLAQGGGDGIIRTGYIYDRNSNLSGKIDDQGNVTVYTYDNLDRRVTATDGLVITTSPLDKNKILGSRNVVTPTPATINNPAFIPAPLIDQQLAATQARLNQLLPLFPPLANQIQDNPPTTMVWGSNPDPTDMNGFWYLIVEDENDNEIFTRYDAINRPIATRVFRSGQADSHAGDPIFAPNPLSDLSNPSGPFPPVIGTNKQNYEYDGRSRLTRATDNNDPAQPNDDSIVRMAWDSLSRQIEETQQIGAAPQQVIDQGWRAENLRSELIYPNNRQIDYTYDLLDRLDTLRDMGAAQPIADYDYIGRDRVLQRLTPLNGTRMTHLNDAGTADVGYDGARRPIQTRFLRTNNSLLVGTQNQYDRADNLLIEQKLHNPQNSEATTYDSSYRSTKFQRPGGGLTPQHQNWQLDGVGNWRQVDAQMRQHSSQNEITQAGPTLIRSDDNGNTNTDANFQYSFDFLNRLRQINRISDGLPIASYSYDAMDRRARKIVINSGPLDGATFFFYYPLQVDAPGVLVTVNSTVIEERNQAGVLTQQYVRDPYRIEDMSGEVLNSCLVLDRNLNGDNTATGPGDQRLFYLGITNNQGCTQNVEYVFGLADINARVVEGYMYDKYGRQTVFLPGANMQVDWGGDDIIQTGGNSALNNPYLFQGQRLDPETQLYNFGSRYLHTDLGRFLTRETPGESRTGTGPFGVKSGAEGWAGAGAEAGSSTGYESGKLKPDLGMGASLGRGGKTGATVEVTPPPPPRVKVRFPWNRGGASNSCWLRVTQTWAGKGWSASFWPRIGQEVIVTFTQGDPDQPIIVGAALGVGARLAGSVGVPIQPPFYSPTPPGEWRLVGYDDEGAVFENGLGARTHEPGGRNYSQEWLRPSHDPLRSAPRPPVFDPGPGPSFDDD